MGCNGRIEDSIYILVWKLYWTLSIESFAIYRHRRTHYFWISTNQKTTSWLNIQSWFNQKCRKSFIMLKCISYSMWALFFFLQGGWRKVRRNNNTTHSINMKLNIGPFLDTWDTLVINTNNLLPPWILTSKSGLWTINNMISKHIV